MLVPLGKIVEGRTSLYVPSVSLRMSEPPTAPVFFNPAGRLNRDVSVGITEAVTGRTFCDSLAGVGARGLRVANESSRKLHVTIVDFNPLALKVAEKSARDNSLFGSCEFVKSETNAFLFSRFGRDSRFDFVDVDPFGSPISYVQGAFNAAADGGIVSLTATDTAVLSGVHPGVARRRYLSQPLKNEFKHETGLRILLNACRLIAAMNDIGLEPIAAHSNLHYLRVYVRVAVGPARAESSERYEGFVASCDRCGERFASITPVSRCERCGAKVVCAGPLWTGPVTDPEVIAAAVKVCERYGLDEARETLEGLVGLETFPPYGFSLERISSALKVPGVSRLEVMSRLSSSGYRVMRQPFEKTGIKTDAGYDEVVEAVSAASRARSIGAETLHPRQT